ncbi:MAG: hypothetical protein AB7O97_00200 [Planctomycetota bacterium]
MTRAHAARLPATCAAVLSALAIAPAQRMPVPDDDGGRMVQLVDVRPLLLHDGPGLRMKGAPPPRLPGLAEFLGAFAEPKPGAGDAIEVLGGSHVCVLGPPALCDWVARTVAEATRRREANELFDFEIRMLRLGDDTYKAVLAPFFAAAPAQPDAEHPYCIVVQDQLGALLLELKNATGVEMLQAPRLLTAQLNRCSLQTGDFVDYVRDFAVRRNGAAAIADPIVDRAFDGIRAEVRAVSLADDRIAVECAFEHAQVQRPLPTSELDLGLQQKVTIQLPRMRTVAIEQRAVLPDGHAVVAASQCEDGEWFATILRVQRRLPDQPR